MGPKDKNKCREKDKDKEREKGLGENRSLKKIKNKLNIICY